MKTNCIILWVCMIFLLQTVYSQAMPVYPIPSYNVGVLGVALFEESAGQSKDNPCRERRKIHIQVNCQKNIADNDRDVTVWIYSLDGKDVLGPYTVSCGNTLEEAIDEREWGVMVKSEIEVYISVWID